MKTIAPAFGGINLEDISAPRCFEIEERLQQELDIPVFHDDQHGTAVVVLAALLNALKIVKKDIRGIKVVVSGVGAAGIADDQDPARPGRREHHRGGRARARSTGADRGHGPHEDVGRRARPTRPELKGRMSRRHPGRGRVHRPVRCRACSRCEDVKSMARDRIVFAMANPVPEIHAGGGGAARARDGHRPLGLPEPDQQRPLLPRLLPRAARLAGARRSTTR